MDTTESENIIQVDQPVNEEKSLYVEFRDELLKDFFNSLPEGELTAVNYLSLLENIDKKEQQEVNEILGINEDDRLTAEEIKKKECELLTSQTTKLIETRRIYGSMRLRIKKIIREFENPMDQYRDTPSPKELYGTKEKLFKSFDLDE